jgi:hypothetical protein
MTASVLVSPRRLDFTNFNHYLANQQLEKTVAKVLESRALYDVMTNKALGPSEIPDIKILGLIDYAVVY